MAKIVCKNCGKIFSAGTERCPQCGAKSSSTFEKLRRRFFPFYPFVLSFVLSFTKEETKDLSPQAKKKSKNPTHPIFYSTDAPATVELAIIAATLAFTLIIVVVEHRDSIIIGTNDANIRLFNTAVIAAFVSMIMYSLSIPVLLCEVLVNQQYTTIELLHFMGAQDEVIARHIRRYVIRQLYVSLRKAVIVDFVLYNLINYAASVYNKYIIVNIMEGGGRVIISALALYIIMMAALSIKIVRVLEKIASSPGLAP